MSDLFALLQTQIVQIAVCVALAAAASMGLRRKPAWALAIWLAVLVKCLTPPVWASPVGLFSVLPTFKRAPAIPASMTIPAPRNLLDVPPPAPMPLESTAAESPTGFVWPSPTTIFASAWLLGAGLVLATGLLRWRGWRRGVESTRVETPPTLAALTSSWAKRLRIAEPRCIAVAERSQGPAASGFWRPTVVVPAFRDRRLLEAALVHEMLHLRRRDQWTGVLQLLVQAAYWFHPCVWWANREASRWIEHNCDAETVTALGCAPREYAELLIRTLEHRAGRRSIPLAAGMSPARFARRRLEAVMRSKQGSVGRTRASGWAVFVAAGALLIPGAATTSEPPKVLPNPAKDVKGAATPPPPVEVGALVYDGHRLGPAMDYLVKRHGLNEDAARNAAVNLAIPNGQVLGKPVAFAVAGRCLMTLAGKVQQDAIAAELARLADYGMEQIVLEFELWKMAQEDLEKLKQGDGKIDDQTSLWFLNAKHKKKLDEMLLGNPKTQRLAAPKITILNGQRGSFTCGQLIPANSDELGKDAPHVHVGVQLKTTPKLSADGKRCHMAFRFESSKLVRMTTYKKIGGEKEISRQSPVLSQRTFETTFMVPVGNTAMFVLSAESELQMICVHCKEVLRGGPPSIDPSGVKGTAAFEDQDFQRHLELLCRRAKNGIAMTKVYPLDHLFEQQARNLASCEAFASALKSILPDCGEISAWQKGRFMNRYDCALNVRVDDQTHQHLTHVIRGLRRGLPEPPGQVPSEWSGAR